LNFLRRAFILAAWIASRGSQAYRERRRLGTHVEIYFLVTILSNLCGEEIQTTNKIKIVAESHKELAKAA
jgi:hypothetical protein